MPLEGAKPFKFTAMSASDTLDSTEEFPGAMRQLSNLVPDPTTKNLWVARPASVLDFDFTTLAGTLGFISCGYIFGDFWYGMIANGSGTFSGFDTPVCINLLTNAQVTVTGGTVSNLPTSPSPTGAWVPPIMALVGTKIMICHPGFPNGANKVGWIDISTPSAPVYAAGDLTTQPFPSTPIAVANFFGRAYYLCNVAGGQPQAVFSDILAPTTRTNANQSLSFGDNVPLTALAPLQLQNQLGGIIQSLIIFKSATNMYQVTGDYALTNNPLTVNVINTATGTLAPNSITNTPKGLIFLAPDGFRLIDQNANVSDPIGEGGSGISVPFIFAVQPTRVIAESNAKIVRCSTQNQNAVGSPQQEWWFDLTRGVWSGPHTFPASLMWTYKNSFVMTPVGVVGKLFQSDYFPKGGSVYVENGNQMMFVYQTSLIPDMGDMDQYSLNEAYIYAAQDTKNTPMIHTVQDEFGHALATVTITNTNVSGIWGAFTWGTGQWGIPASLTVIPIKYDHNFVFSRASFTFTGSCNAGVEFGAFWARIKHLGYMKGAL
jgi:hypothetical protein